MTRRRAVGQCAGLVEHHGVDPGELLHVAAALDDHAGAGGQRHRGQHGCRGGDANAGAVVDDDEREEAVEVAGDHGGAGGERQGRGDEPVGEAFGMVLHAGVADRRGFDQPHDLAGGGRRPDAQGTQRDLALADDGSGEGRFALAAMHRQALAGDRLLVDGGGAVDDLAVDRDHPRRDTPRRCRRSCNSAAGIDTTSPSRNSLCGLRLEPSSSLIALSRARGGQGARIPLAELDPAR